MSEKVTSKSTKSVIWDAYQAKLKELAATKSPTMKERKETNIIDNAHKISKDSNVIIRNINSFLNDFTANINNLNEVQQAINLKGEEIKNLYDIEIEAHTLEALKLAIKDLENDRESLESKLEEKEDQINDFYQENLQKAKAKLAQEMEVEKYNFERRSKIRTDQFEDEIKARRKAFDEYVSGKKNEIKNETSELEKRVEEVEEKESNIKLLETEIKDLKDEIKKIAEETTQEVKKKMEKEKEIALSIQRSKYESKIEHSNSIIDLKDNTIIDLKQSMTSLENKLDEAYKKVNELATNAVSSAKDKELTSHLADALRSRNDNK